MTAHSNNAKGNILFLRKEAQYCVCEKVVFMRLVEKPPHGAVENASLNGWKRKPFAPLNLNLRNMRFHLLW